VSVSWGAPVQQEIKVRGYVIGWGLGVPDEFIQSLDENNRFYEIVGLTPNSEYVISLRARNSVGDGQPVYDTVRTREEIPVEVPAPLEVPVGLRAIPMSGTSIVVYWTDTTLSKSQHVTDNRQYIVRYSSTGSTRFRYHNTTDLNCMIGDLRPNTQYEFAVKVVKGRRESSWSMSVLNMTNLPTPGSPPRDLSVRTDDRNPQNVILTWQTPKQSPGITGYVVFYTIDTSKRDRDWSVEAVLGDTNTAVIKNLKPMTTYYFKVQSRNSKGQIGPFSTMVAHTTGADSGVRESMATGQLPPPIVYTIIGITVFTLIIAIIVVFRVCRRKSSGTPEHSKKSYQKNNAGIIKPPDLWIHHDQMELKNLGKNSQPPPPVQTPGYSDCASSSGGVVGPGIGVGSVAGIGGSEVGMSQGGGRDTMTLPRSSHDYETESSMSHVTNSLDKRNYVPGYMSEWGEGESKTTGFQIFMHFFKTFQAIQ
jgi:neogenin